MEEKRRERLIKIRKVIVRIEAEGEIAKKKTSVIKISEIKSKQKLKC